MGSDPKYIEPDFNLDPICYRVQIKEIGSELIFGCDWKKIGPDYPETGKHPEEYKHNRELEASAARDEKAKRRRQSAIEKQEHEVAEKRRALHDTGKPVSEINFVYEELPHHEDVHREVTDNLCHDSKQSVTFKPRWTQRAAKMPQTMNRQQLLMKKPKQKSLTIYSRDRIVTHAQTLISSIQTTKFAFTPVYPPKKF